MSTKIYAASKSNKQPAYVIVKYNLGKFLGYWNVHSNKEKYLVNGICPFYVSQEILQSKQLIKA